VRPHVVAVSVLTFLAAAGYSAYSLILQYTARTSSYDLVIFDQAVRSYAHFHPGISVIKGYHNGFGPNFSVLGDHWSPIISVLAPLYWIYDGPQTLLIAQGVLFALAIPPLWLFTRRAFGGDSPAADRKATAAAYLVSVAYALSWTVAGAVAFDFHEVAFAPVLMAVALERLQAGRLKTALIALAGLLLVKEDMGFLVAGIGVALVISGQNWVGRQRLVGAALIVAGLADTLLATYVLIPAFGGRADYYWAYGELGNSAAQAIVHLFTHPSVALNALITPRAKVDLVLWLLAPFVFLPLLSPLSVAAIPLVLERLLDVKFPNWWATSGQYNAYLVIILACAAVDGAARLDRWISRTRHGWTGLGWAVITCAAAVALVPRFAFGQALHGSFYHRDAQANAAVRAANAVPSGVTVEATDDVGPQLSGRDTVLLWNGYGGSPTFPPWVVANVARDEFTFANVAEEVQRVALLRHHGYQIVFQGGGYVVMRSPGASG
jgi:uncharacterized membrane protein